MPEKTFIKLVSTDSCGWVTFLINKDRYTYRGMDAGHNDRVIRTAKHAPGTAHNFVKSHSTHYRKNDEEWKEIKGKDFL